MFGDLQNQMNSIANSLFEAIPEDDEGPEDVAPDDAMDSNNNNNDRNNIPLSLAASGSHKDGFSPIQLTDLITSNANALLNQNRNNNENDQAKLNENPILSTLKQNSTANLNSTSNSASNSINANSLDRTGDSDIISASPSVVSQRFSEHISENNYQENDDKEENASNDGILVPQIQQIATNLINGNQENNEYTESARSNQSSRSNRSNQSSAYNKNSSRSLKSTKSKVSASASGQNSTSQSPRQNSTSQSPRQLSTRSNSSKRISATSSTSSLAKRRQQQNDGSENSSRPSSRSMKSNNSNINTNDGNRDSTSQQSSARSIKSSSRSKTNSAISSARSNKEKEITPNDDNKNVDLTDIIKRPFSVLAGNLEQVQPPETDEDKQQNQPESNDLNEMPNEDNQIPPDEIEDQQQPAEDNDQKEVNQEEEAINDHRNDELEENNEERNENNEENQENRDENKEENKENNENDANTEDKLKDENNDNTENITNQTNENEGVQTSIEEGLNVTDENTAAQVPIISHFPKRTIYEEDELDAKLQEFIKTNGKSYPRIPVDMRNQLFQHISRRRVQAIENQDYDNGEKLMVAQENLRKAMNKDLMDNEETNEESMNANRLSEAKYELKIATEKWDQSMKDLNYKLKEQEEQIISAQQAELQKLADFWSDPSKFHEFNKASSHLLSMREIERNMALTGDFKGAKQMKKRALALEKKETQEAQKRAQEAMVQNFEQMKQKHQMQLDGHRRLAHKLMLQEEVKRDNELTPLKMAVKKYENYQKIKIDNMRETKPPPKRNPPVSKSMLVKKTKKDSIILTDDRPPITTPRTMERLARLRETKRAEQLALTKVETKGVLKRQIKAMRPLKEDKESLSGTKNGTF